MQSPRCQHKLGRGNSRFTSQVSAPGMVRGWPTPSRPTPSRPTPSRRSGSNQQTTAEAKTPVSRTPAAASEGGGHPPPLQRRGAARLVSKWGVAHLLVFRHTADHKTHRRSCVQPAHCGRTTRRRSPPRRAVLNTCSKNTCSEIAPAGRSGRFSPSRQPAHLAKHSTALRVVFLRDLDTLQGAQFRGD